MDTEKLLLKAQKNHLTLTLAISALLLIMVSLFSGIPLLFFKVKSLEGQEYELVLSILVYLALFSLSLYNRLKISLKAAKANFYLHALVTVYLIIKSVATLFILTGRDYTKFLGAFIPIFLVMVLILMVLNYLFYKAYKATDTIIQLN